MHCDPCLRGSHENASLALAGNSSVFSRTPSTRSSWDSVLDIDGEAADDVSGWSVSLSSDGSVVAIGAIGNDGNGSNSGHVRVYAWDGSSWVQRGADINGEAAGDGSGAVSLSSDGFVVAIGAPDNADAFPLDATDWLDSDTDGIGNNTDLDDDNDGLTDVQEGELGTDPLSRDTDRDGWIDKEEVEEGTDPLAASFQPEIQSGRPVSRLYMATQ